MGMGCSSLASRALPTAADTALAAAMPMDDPVPVHVRPPSPGGAMTAMASEVVPVSLNPRSDRATDLASTSGIIRLTIPSSVSGTGDTTQMLIVPALRAAALLVDTALFSG